MVVIEALDAGIVALYLTQLTLGMKSHVSRSMPIMRIR